MTDLNLLSEQTIEERERERALLLLNEVVYYEKRNKIARYKIFAK